MNPRPIYKEIGALIRSRRKKLSRTQAELAKQLGISRASLANIETGRQNVMVHQLYKLAGVLDLSPHDLLPEFAESRADERARELPLPHDLKAEQRAQIVRLLEGTEIEPKHRGGQPFAKKH